MKLASPIGSLPKGDTVEVSVSIVDLMDLIERDIKYKIEIDRKLDAIMATQAENQAKIDALATTLEKVVAEVKALKEAYDAGQVLDFTNAERLVTEADEVNADVPPVDPETPSEA